MVVSANTTAPIIISNNTDNFFIILFDPFSFLLFLFLTLNTFPVFA